MILLDIFHRKMHNKAIEIPEYGKDVENERIIYMKILFYRWHGITEADALEVMCQMGAEVRCLDYPLENFDEDRGIGKEADKLFEKCSFDCIFSFNYFPVLSRISEKKGVRYISWVYDSPHFTLYSKTITNSCNEVYLFDYCMYQELTDKGMGNVHYLPLAVHSTRLQKQESQYQKGYLHEVSFVGNLYNNEYNFYDSIKYLPEYLKGFLEGSMEAQLQVWGYDFLGQQIDNAKMQEVLRYVKLSLGENYFPAPKEIFLNMLRRKMTVLERKRFIEAIAKQFPTVIYCGSKTPELPMVKNMGYAEYLKQMPEIFKRSKINLNITLRSILSGIPLRVLDIMGAGGFALSNYQIEIAEYFQPGKEIVVYESMEDCLEKIQYYLEHDGEREKIAGCGCEKVRREFSYERQLKKIFGE